MSWLIRLMPWALALTAMPAWAQTDAAELRWFEVEVLVIKHQQPDGPVEHFDWLPPATAKATANDLLSGYYAPNFWALLQQLPECPRDNWQTIFTDSTALPCHDWAELNLPDGKDWYQPQRILASFAEAPVVIDGGGGDINQTSQPFLMPASAHQLTELRQQLVRRKVATPLLHVTYRQPVFNRNQDFQMRLFGGRNYAEAFLPSGYQRPPRQWSVGHADQPIQADPLQQLMELQQQGQLTFRVQQADTPPPPPTVDVSQLAQQPVWELDGLLHIYLVGNYLHIDSQLELRQPQPVVFSSISLAEQAQAALQQGSNNLFLRRFELDQLRRVISHETHYFDHPKFALVVQIRRTELSARR
ncbi:CsiV family protein [Pseudidiomarina mangrovi]|uniref:CsiV family protein n=1 Tax=Pseudidiomarina mangrovi TaxID=2487133 RepID=UPI000FC9F317|nr:CsiV family protein [Pseudidiomarina mangrovi]